MGKATSDAHQPVLLDAVIQALRIQPSGIYVDCTFGRGGHTGAILEQLDSHGRLYAIDKDPDAIAVAQQLMATDHRFQCTQGSFAQLMQHAKNWGIVGQVNGIFMDFGVSSPQLDNPARGFSFLRDGPLDMRMDPNQGLSAAQWLSQVGEVELTKVLKQFGEERFAKRIARAIVEQRRHSPLQTTTQLAKLIDAAVPRREPGKHPATRSFQAIRIIINRELEDIHSVLSQVPDILAEQGRLVAISFQSLEDRIVKRALRRMAEGDPLPPDLPVFAAQTGGNMQVIGRARKADDAEIKQNPRARSAVLRVAERLS